MSLKPYTNGISILEVGDQLCVFRHVPENERYGVVTRITPVLLYRTIGTHRRTLTKTELYSTVF